MIGADLLHAFCRTRSGHVGQIIGVMEREDVGGVELIVKLEPPLPKFHGVTPKDYLLHVALLDCQGWNFADTREPAGHVGEQKS